MIKKQVFELKKKKKTLTERVVMLVSRNILLSWLFPLSQHKKVIQYLLSWLCI
jgi:hypothetical protein